MPTPLSLRDALRATSRPEAHLSILTKGLLLIAGPLVLQLLLLGVLFTEQRHAVEAERRELRSREVLQQASTIEGMVLEQTAAMRGAVLAGALLPNEARTASDTTVLAQVEALRVLVRDSGPQRQRADSLRDATREFEDWIRSQHARIVAGRIAEATQRIRAGEGNALLGRVRDDVSALLTEEARVVEARRASLEEARASERRTLVIVLATGTVAAGLVAWLFARGIGTRLAAVSRNAERLARGQPLEAPLAGSDEIAALDDVLYDAGYQLDERRAAETHYKAELERRATDLARVNRELSQTARDNEMFVYSVSHDLRSPLVNLQGFSRELTRSCDELRVALADAPVPAEVRERTLGIVDRDVAESIRYIRTAVTRAAGIIDALLRLSRAGRVEYHVRPVELATTVATVLDAMRTTIAERGARVEVRPLGTIYGDPTAVEQIVANLLHNALSYLDVSREGRIEIGMIDRVPPTAVGPPPGAWEEGCDIMYVRDNGSGIPESHMPKIFVAFQRLQPAKVQGEGIGLALVRRMVERHHGAIWVESAEGRGSTFYVALPAEARARAFEAVEDAAAVGAS